MRSPRRFSEGYFESVKRRTPQPLSDQVAFLLRPLPDGYYPSTTPEGVQESSDQQSDFVFLSGFPKFAGKREAVYESI